MHHHCRRKKQAVFHHPLGFELYDGLAMDLHAMTYAEPMLKEIEELRDSLAFYKRRCDALQEWQNKMRDLELSQVTQAKTARELALEAENARWKDRYILGDAIRRAYLKHGNDSWCSIADEVISEMPNVRGKRRPTAAPHWAEQADVSRRWTSA